VIVEDAARTAEPVAAAAPDARVSLATEDAAVEPVPVLVFRIVAAEPDAAGSKLKIDLGKNSSISTTWHAAILDDDGRRVDNGELVIVEIVGGGGANRLCIARAKIPVNVVAQNYRRVRFDP